MVHNSADNAVMTKVRALYGKRLTENDYGQLLSKKTVVEVAGYLKNETYYSEDLAEVKEELVHRGQLENLVRRRTLGTYQKLLKYAGRDPLFMRLYIMKSEIEQILMAIRLLNSGSIGRYIITLPAHLARLMSFDLFAVAGIKNFDDLLAILEHCAYGRIVGSFRPAGSRRIVDITSCEAALLTYYYNTVLSIVGRDYRGETRADLKQLLYQQATMHNAMMIFRMRQYLYPGASRDIVAKRIVRVEGAGNRLLDRLLDAADTAAMQEILKGFRPFRFVDWEVSAQRLSHQLTQVREAYNRRLFRFSVKPVVVVISYMTLLEVEQNNIIHIIEGIRYGVTPADLKQLICI